MSTIKHHTPDHLMAAYTAGSLPHPFAMVVAAQISMDDTCRASYEAHQAVGGIILEDTETSDVSDDLKSNVLDQLDASYVEKPRKKPQGVYPAPVMAALKGRAPRWKSLGLGVRQDILWAGPEGSVRLLYIPANQAVPDHSHGGLELTLVLQGSFSDETGEFNVGDLEVANEDLEHTPFAGGDQDCICLAATDAPLRFRSFMPRLLQPLFRI